MKSILMKSKELRKYRTSKHTNTVINPTAFARQAIFLMLMMFMSVGSAWGDTVKPNTPTTTTDCGEQILSNSNEFTITGTELVNIIGFTPNYLRVYATDGTDLVQISNVTGTYREYVNCGVNGWVCSRNDGATGTWQAEFKVQLPSNAKKLYLCASSTTVSVSDGVYNEPADVKAYFFSFITESEVTFISASESLTETQIDIPYSSDPVALDLYTNYMSDIQTKLGSEYLYYFYCRWYLRKASKKTIVYMTNTTFGNYSSVTGYSYAGGNSENSIGIIWKSNDLAYNQRFAQGNGWNKNDDIRQAVLKNVTWTSPNADYEVVCVMSASEPTMAGTKVWKEPTLQAKYVFHMDAPDNFESGLKSGASDTGEYTVTVPTPISTTSMDIDLSQAMASCASPVYARFQVLHNDVAVDLKTNTSLLSVSGTGISAKLPKDGTLGYYVYNAGSTLPSDLSVTLNVDALEFPQYKVVCILSSGAEADELDYDTGTGEVKKEPNWDVKFTYKFKNDLIEITRQLDASSLTNPYAQINIHQDVLDKLGTTEEVMKDSWHGHWFVRHKDNHSQQDIAWGNSQAEGKWNLWVGNNNGNWFQGNHFGATIMLNYALCGYDNVDGSSAGSSNRRASWMK